MAPVEVAVMAGPSVIQQRQEEVLRMLGEGYGCTELVTALADRWGCSRRTARRAVYKAHAELVGDLEHVEKQDMLAACVNRLERIARKAEKAGQYAAAVGAARSLMDISMQSSHHRPPMGRFGHG
jgi:DNA-binding CsgD family transcriptional regulator